MTGSAAGSQPAKRRAAAKKTESKQDPDLVWVDTNDLTAGQIEAAEAAAGVPMTHYGHMDYAQGALNRALGWVVRAATDPDIEYDNKQCGRGLRPQCGDCRCARRLKVMYVQSEAPVPPSGGNG